jgi:hypothetical protein
MVMAHQHRARWQHLDAERQQDGEDHPRAGAQGVAEPTQPRPWSMGSAIHERSPSAASRRLSRTEW